MTQSKAQTTSDASENSVETEKEVDALAEARKALAEARAEHGQDWEP